MIISSKGTLCGISTVKKDVLFEGNEWLASVDVKTFIC